MYELAVIEGLDGIGDRDAFLSQRVDEPFHVGDPVVDHELFRRGLEVLRRLLERAPLCEALLARICALPPFEDGAIGVGLQSEVGLIPGAQRGGVLALEKDPADAGDAFEMRDVFGRGID